jgi:hypothetical protein
VNRILYVSTPPSGLTQAGLDTTIRSLRRSCLVNNARRHVTGALAYSLSGFAQALEGDAGAVDETFARILADTRHSDVRLIERREAASRMFPDWSMAFAPIGEDVRLDLMAPSALLRFLIEAAQNSEGARPIPGFGPAPEALARFDLR